MDKKKKPFQVTASSVRCSEEQLSLRFLDTFMLVEQLMSGANVLASRVVVTHAKKEDPDKTHRNDNNIPPLTVSDSLST